MIQNAGLNVIPYVTRPPRHQYQQNEQQPIIISKPLSQSIHHAGQLIRLFFKLYLIC